MGDRRIRREHPEGVPPVRRRELVAWAFYDFANSGYTTVVITAVFNAYFVSVIAGKAAWATLAWTLALSVSYVVIMLTAPLLGAWADLRARKKLLLAASTVLCIAGTAALALCGPGDVWLAMVLVIVSNIGFGSGENLVAAFLPELATPKSMGRLSGYGWGLGYVGGLLVLAASLWWIQGAAGRGEDTAHAVRDSMLLTAFAFALTAGPALATLRERARAQVADGAAIMSLAWSRVRGALAGTHGLVDLTRFLWCIVCYQAGVGTVITIAAIYTQEALGFTTTESIKLIMLVNITAAVGAVFFGWLQDRLGHRLTLALSLVLWLVALGLLWSSNSRAIVWLAANLAGLSLGASQSAGRAMVGYMCPESREAEVFGLWGLAVKLSMIVGPLSYGLISWLTKGDHRSAMLATALFFIGGLLLLARVDVKRGHEVAQAASAA